MTRDAFGVVTGLAVLIMGVVAVVDLVGPQREVAVEEPPPPITVDVSEPPVPAASIEQLPGVGPDVTRVLQWSGNAGTAEDGDVAQLPPSVTAVLIEYGASLLVPTAPGAGQ